MTMFSYETFESYTEGTSTRDGETKFWERYHHNDVSEFKLNISDLSVRSIRENCFYCNNQLSEFLKQGALDEKSLGQYIVGRNCTECGWWTIYEREKTTSTNYGRDHSVIHSGICRRYEIGDTKIPLGELRRWLEKHPNDMRSANPFSFEKVVQSVFSEHFTDCEVLHVGGGGPDRGVDLKIVRNDEIQYLVQVKRRRSESARETVDVVRSLNGVLLRDGVPKGIVVTTAEDFTKDAKIEAEISNMSKTGVFHRYSLDLMAFNDVADLLRIHPAEISNAPWKPVAKFLL